MPPTYLLWTRAQLPVSSPGLYFSHAFPTLSASPELVYPSYLTPVNSSWYHLPLCEWIPPPLCPHYAVATTGSSCLPHPGLQRQTGANRERLKSWRGQRIIPLTVVSWHDHTVTATQLAPGQNCVYLLPLKWCLIWSSKQDIFANLTEAGSKRLVTNPEVPGQFSKRLHCVPFSLLPHSVLPNELPE